MMMEGGMRRCFRPATMEDKESNQKVFGLSISLTQSQDVLLSASAAKVHDSHDH